MPNGTVAPDLSGRHVLIPGSTGGVGEGAVRAYLAAGADVVVPTRSQQRADEFRRLLGDAATSHLHLVVHDYTTFAGAEALGATMEDRLGSVDDVVAPIGGWWAGKRLWEIDESDWRDAFVDLATTHMAVLRAVLPRMRADGAYCGYRRRLRVRPDLRQRAGKHGAGCAADDAAGPRGGTRRG